MTHVNGRVGVISAVIRVPRTTSGGHLGFPLGGMRLHLKGVDGGESKISGNFWLISWS